MLDDVTGQGLFGGAFRQPRLVERNREFGEVVSPIMLCCRIYGPQLIDRLNGIDCKLPQPISLRTWRELLLRHEL
jgi:hypothetical protein